MSWPIGQMYTNIFSHLFNSNVIFLIHNAYPNVVKVVMYDNIKMLWPKPEV